MTQDKFKKAQGLQYRIASVEKLCTYDWINANGGHDPAIFTELMTEGDFKKILNDANEQIREKARRRLEELQQLFDEL